MPLIVIRNFYFNEAVPFLADFEISLNKIFPVQIRYFIIDSIYFQN